MPPLLENDYTNAEIDNDEDSIISEPKFGIPCDNKVFSESRSEPDESFYQKILRYAGTSLSDVIHSEDNNLTSQLSTTLINEVQPVGFLVNPDNFEEDNIEFSTSLFNEVESVDFLVDEKNLELNELRDTAANSNLVNTIESLFDDKRHKCSRCSYATYSKQLLKYHEASKHDIEYVMICPSCPFTTYTKGCLNRHAISHLEIKPFKCEVCDKQFNRKELLKKHILRKH